MVARVGVLLLLVGLTISLCVQCIPRVPVVPTGPGPVTEGELHKSQERYIGQLESVYGKRPLEEWPESARARYLHALKVRDAMLSGKAVPDPP